jgi:hypothetical protein
MLPPGQPVGFLRQLLFRLEGGLQARRVAEDLSDRPHAQLMFEALGLPPEAAVQALGLMRRDTPLRRASPARDQGLSGPDADAEHGAAAVRCGQDGLGAMPPMA